MSCRLFIFLITRNLGTSLLWVFEILSLYMLDTKRILRPGEEFASTVIANSKSEKVKNYFREIMKTGESYGCPDPIVARGENNVIIVLTYDPRRL